MLDIDVIKFEFYHIALIPRISIISFFVETEVTQSIEYRLAIIVFIATVTMLMMVNHSICSCIYKETICFYHTR